MTDVSGRSSISKVIKASYICFDIETEPYDRKTIMADAEPFDAEAVKLGVRKKQAVIDEYIQEQRLAHYNKLIADAALHATTGRVLVAGIHDTLEQADLILEGEEPAILTNFWAYLDKIRSTYSSPVLTKYLGFNILGFDLPFLCRRSWHHSIHVPPWVMDGRYFDRQFVDLAVIWQCGNRYDLISLDKLARFVGLEGKERTGKGFHELYRGDHEAAIAYIKHDLILCAQIAAKMKV